MKTLYAFILKKKKNKVSFKISFIIFTLPSFYFFKGDKRLQAEVIGGNKLQLKKENIWRNINITEI